MGARHLCPYVGPVQLAVGNRRRFAGTLVLGDEVLLGAMPMEDMDLVISPNRRTVEPNPVNPNIAATAVKVARCATENLPPTAARAVPAFGSRAP